VVRNDSLWSVEVMNKPERDAVALPAQLEATRVVNAAQAAAYWGVSLPHWRRLYRAGRVPRPIKIGERKLGWRTGDLLAEIERRAAA
jgi:predicted DNA-binding transcriptional regulator AlpA